MGYLICFHWPVPAQAETSKHSRDGSQRLAVTFRTTCCAWESSWVLENCVRIRLADFLVFMGHVGGTNEEDWEPTLWVSYHCWPIRLHFTNVNCSKKCRTYILPSNLVSHSFFRVLIFRLKNCVTDLFHVCIAISQITFGRTLSLERKHTLVKVVLCLVVFSSVELTPIRTIGRI